ncbi:MAG TPA: hypothetical protein VK736_06490, partial [Candidatus Binatia bacterium]|nr:hypothetical protein [Candidatus Binatia bacterium]
MSPVRAYLCAVVLIFSAGCTSASAEPAPSSTPFSVGGQAAAIGCGNDIDLVAPDGREIDLTGLWTSPDFPEVALWNIRQVGDCFFMVFRDPYEDTDYSDQVCDGRIQTNFEITGRCVDFRGISRQAELEPQVFLILFDATNEVQIQRCPASRAPGSCDEPMIRFVPAETAS